MGNRVYLELPEGTFEPRGPDSHRGFLGFLQEPRLWYLLFAHPEAVRISDGATVKLQLTGRLLLERLLAFRGHMDSLFRNSAFDPRSKLFLRNDVPVGSHAWNQIRAIATKYPVRDVLQLFELLSWKYDDLQPLTLNPSDVVLNCYEGRIPQFLQHLNERLQGGTQVFQALAERQFTHLNVPEYENPGDATPAFPINAEILTWIVTSNGEGAFYEAVDYYVPGGVEEGNFSLWG